jgi:hypothetical protein
LSREIEPFYFPAPKHVRKYAVRRTALNREVYDLFDRCKGRRGIFPPQRTESEIVFSY